MRKSHAKIYAAAVLVILSFPICIRAALTATSNFNDIPNGQFGGYANGIDSRLPPLTISGVTFSFVPSGSSGQHNGGESFPFTAGSGSDPAVQYFFGPPVSGPPPTIINFSQPLSAFGVTFTFFTSYPADGLLDVFDGPNANGNLLGSVVGTVPAPPWSASNRPVDFVAILSDQVNIQSAEVVGNTNPKNYGIAGVGFSMVPEPPGVLLAGFGFLCLGLFGHRGRDF